MPSDNLLYVLIIVPALLGMLAQQRVRAIYEEYGGQPNRQEVNGLEIARRLLAYYGLTNVTIERADGHLTDHYDPQTKTLRLSDSVAKGHSVTSLGIVAHEVGHAAQDAEGYHFMRLRTSLAQRIGVVARWSSVVFIGGMLFGIPILMLLSGVFLAGLVLFMLVTLPVERNASDRALKSLEQAGLAAVEELAGVRRVLRAAAFTYLSGLGQRLGTFLFFVATILFARGGA